MASPGESRWSSQARRRAVDCARDETYLPALDPEGTPILGEAEFSIGFLN